MRLIKALVAIHLVALAAAAHAAIGLGALSQGEAATGLREALAQGADRAIATLGRPDGFLGNAAVRIPLPPALQQAAGAMRTFGMGRYADELTTAMNRAAEAAVPEARALLVDSVRKMSLSDAKSILGGPDDAATQYFRRTSGEQILARFLPIVREATSRVGLAETYNRFASQGATLGLVKAEDANIDSYVARRAVDGLFLMIAEEERNIRKDPAAAASSVAKRVFEALGR